jgi:hypothetical protein
VRFALSFSLYPSLSRTLTHSQTCAILSLARATLSLSFHFSLSFGLARTLIMNTRDSFFHTHTLYTLYPSLFFLFFLHRPLSSFSMLINYYYRM